jgi:hypothetical protein
VIHSHPARVAIQALFGMAKDNSIPKSFEKFIELYL